MKRELEKRLRLLESRAKLVEVKEVEPDPALLRVWLRAYAAAGIVTSPVDELLQQVLEIAKERGLRMRLDNPGRILLCLDEVRYGLQRWAFAKVDAR